MGTIGENLKVLRENKRWTKKHMADILGINSYTTISKWESGDNHPRGSEIKMLCKLFNVSADHLLGMDDESNYYKYYKGEITSSILEDVLLDNEIKWINLPDEVMGDYAGSHDVFFVDMPFTSMNETITPGSKIGIKPCTNINDLTSNDIILYNFENEYSIKRFFYDTDSNKLILRPESIDKLHTDTVISYNDIDKIQIYGKIIVNISNYSN